MSRPKGSVSSSAGARQLLFDTRTDEIRKELEAFWNAYIGFLLTLDSVQSGVDADSDLFP